MLLTRQVVTDEDYDFLREWMCKKGLDRIYSDVYDEYSDEVDHMYGCWMESLDSFFRHKPGWLARQCINLDIEMPNDSKVRSDTT